MKYVRAILYTIVFILFLEVVKTIIQKKELVSSFFWGTLVAAIQFLACLAIGFTVIIVIFFRKRIKNSKGMLLAGGIFLLLVAGMEGLATYWLNHPGVMPGFLQKAYSYYYDQYNRNIIQFDGKLTIHDTALFYKFKPGVSGRFSNVEFDTRIDANSLGLRDNEASLHQPAVICLGDSYAMGWGIEQEETFAKRLEKMSGMKVLNGGMSSFGTVREFTRLKSLDTSALKYVVVQYCINDYGETTIFMENGHKLPISPAKDFDSLVRMQSWNTTYFPGKNFLAIGQLFVKMQINRIRRTFPVESANKEPDARLQATKFLEVFNNPAFNGQKVKLIVVLVDEPNFRNSAFPEELQKLAQEPPYKEKFAAGVTVINMFKYLTRGDYFYLDMHLRASGHQKIADRVWEAIRQP